MTSTVIVFSCYTFPCTIVLLSLTRYLVIFSLKVFSCYTLPNIVLLLCFALQCSLVLNTVIFDMHWFIPCLTLFYLVVLCFELNSCYPLLKLCLTLLYCNTFPYRTLFSCNTFPYTELLVSFAYTVSMRYFALHCYTVL